VAEGVHLLQEALSFGREISAVLVSSSAASQVETHTAAMWSRDPQAWLTDRSASAAQPPRLFVIEDALFASLVSTETTQGVITLVKPLSWSWPDLLSASDPAVRPGVKTKQNPERSEGRHARSPLLLILDAIQDPGNAGTILRSAEAFQATGCVFLKGSVNPYNPKCIRASAGSVFRMPLLTALDLEELLEQLDPSSPANLPSSSGDPNTITLYAAAASAETALHQADLRSPTAIVIGNEGQGVRPELLARARGLRIPTHGVESLNAAISAAVILYECQRQRESDHIESSR
jgi:TrmH family RNA methyltransferase